MAYWVLVNSLLEEYVWRWFVMRQAERLVGSHWAIALSAAGFTLHHVLAMATYFDARMTAVASLGVFSGGCIWSFCYVKYRSILPGYASHAIVDLVIFLIGYRVLFC